jgi:hypothetical protein
MNLEIVRQFTELLNAYRDACYETGYYSACCEKSEGDERGNYRLRLFDAMKKRHRCLLAINDFYGQESTK